ncbi:MAG TPA: sulfate adenylyltransferase [Actinomycetes bacterium]|jgi:sulfate adenylyltransferase|nr:sulfate adenylyltransferase [Actinomycetes bacterium]
MSITDLAVACEAPNVPHGGRLVERRLEPEEAAELVQGAPSITLSPAEAADLRALATGAYSPLTGFMSSAEHEACTHTMRLPDGVLWPIPVCLGVPDPVSIRGDRLALRDAHGNPLGVLDVQEVYERDRLGEAERVFGTTDPAHPGAARVLGAPALAVAGPIRAVVRPLDGLAGRYALTPAETRASFLSRGWRTIVGFQTRNPIHRAHEYLQKCALEICDGLLLHPLVGPTKESDVPVEVRMRAYQAALGYFPADRVLLATLVAPMRYAGPREAILHALVRKNHGCTHFIVGRDQAGVGAYYGPFDAQRLIASLSPQELGITPLLFDKVFHCAACGGMASAKTCPHPDSERVALSGTRVRGMLSAGERVLPHFVRPEVAEVLRGAYQRPNGDGQAVRRSAGGAEPISTRATHAGFVVWFTGLSGAGKSTMARALASRLLERGHRLELLDGDEVRTNLSQGLGFSREDRDANIARIGYVAAKLAGHGVAVLVAAISPYREARDRVRSSVDHFVEVHVATPLATCAERDVKGLYARALAGQIPQFTGVSDPYEPPLAPEVVLRTDHEPVEGSVGEILACLERLGLTASVSTG